MPRKASGVTNGKSQKIVKKLPSSENGPGVLCKTISGNEYFISQCLDKMRFTLWNKTSDGYQQISAAKSPLDLYELIPWNK